MENQKKFGGPGAAAKRVESQTFQLATKTVNIRQRGGGAEKLIFA
jgi:hypothetical protein